MVVTLACKDAAAFEVFGQGHAQMRIVKHAQIVRLGGIGDVDLARPDGQLGLTQSSPFDELVNWPVELASIFSGRCAWQSRTLGRVHRRHERVTLLRKCSRYSHGADWIMYILLSRKDVLCVAVRARIGSCGAFSKGRLDNARSDRQEKDALQWCLPGFDARSGA